MIPNNLQKIVKKVLVNRSGGRSRIQNGPARRWQPAPDINQEESGTTRTAEQNRDYLKQLLDRCTEKLNRGKFEPQKLNPGDPCDVIKGKFYGARGIVIDLDFIKNRVLVELKSYRDPVWMGFDEIRS